MKDIEEQIEKLISTLNYKINYDKIYIIKHIKRDLKKNGYDYIPVLKNYYETKVRISENYIIYLEEIVKYLESILK